MSKKTDVSSKAAEKGADVDVRSSAPETAVSGALEKKATTALASAGVDLAADAGMGMENADKDSFAIPFLAVLQGLSPQCDADSGIDGAKPGLLINTVTNELMNTAMVIPVAFQRKFLRWAPRDSGGGFKGELSVSAVEQMIADKQAVTDEEGKLRYEGNILRDTRVHYVLCFMPDERIVPMVMSLSSTQIKASKKWMSLINGLQMRASNGKVFTPPSFSHKYIVATEKQENDKGKWFGVKIAVSGQVDDPELYAAAKAFHSQIVSGKVTIKHEDAVGEESEQREGF